MVRSIYLMILRGASSIRGQDTKPIGGKNSALGTGGVEGK